MAQPRPHPGVMALAPFERLIIRQQVEIFEAITGIETQNSYHVYTPTEQLVWKAKEDSNFLARQCCANQRAFTMPFQNLNMEDVWFIDRDFACQCCFCLPIMLQNITISSPRDQLIGSVTQLCSCYPKYEVKNWSNVVVLQIEGPFCTSSTPCNNGNVVFKILSTDGVTEIGNITKSWGGLAREFFTDADLFSISFPKDLDVKIKAVLLSAAILIDFLFYEDQ